MFQTSFLGPDGREMSDEAWDSGYLKCMGVRLAGDQIGDVDERGEPIVGETMLIVLNAHWEPIPFTLPEHQADRHWERLIDTADPAVEPGFTRGGDPYDLRDRSLAVFRLRPLREEAGDPLSAAQAKEVLAPAPRVPELKDRPSSA